jgi:NAD-dependent dihydropyrimidine dehydrogenase PreA subunit
MTYVIVEPCIATKDSACAQVCPVECIYEGKEMYYIDPVDCIDCNACEPVCPVQAIFPADQVPEKWKDYIQKNAAWFETEEGTKAKETGRIMEGKYRALSSDKDWAGRVSIEKVSTPGQHVPQLHVE